MTSEIGTTGKKVEVENGVSRAMWNLKYAIGKEKVNLEEIQPWELELLINEHLNSAI